MELIPIKVKIGLNKENGYHEYPDWTKLQIVQDSGLGDAYKMDNVGGWKYDKTSGHQESTEDSPLGVQYGMLLVEEEFARQAVKMFPELVTIMTEEEAESFYNTKVTAHISEYKTDQETLVALKAELDLANAINKDTTDIKARIDRALNPQDDEKGIKENKIKTFSKLKELKNVTIKKDINIAP